MPGHDAADSLAKEGTTKQQVERSSSYAEVKTILKAKQHSKSRLELPRYNKTDPYYLLTSSSLPRDRLVGIVVKASAPRAADPLVAGFFRVESNQ